jgi:ribosomal protein S27AE
MAARLVVAVTETLHRLRCPQCGEAVSIDGDKEDTRSYCLKCQRVVEPVRRPPQRSLELVKAAHLAYWKRSRKR